MMLAARSKFGEVALHREGALYIEMLSQDVPLHNNLDQVRSAH